MTFCICLPSITDIAKRRQWAGAMVNKAQKCVAVAPSPLENPKFPSALPGLNCNLPSQPEVGSLQKQKSPIPKGPRSQRSPRNTAGITTILDSNPSTIDANVAPGDSNLSRVSSRAITSATVRTSAVKLERRAVKDRLSRGDFYTPPGSTLASHGDFYRPGPKGSESMGTRGVKQTTPSPTTPPSKPKVRLDTSQEWVTSEKRPIPRDPEYGRLRYEDENDLRESPCPSGPSLAGNTSETQKTYGM